MLDREFWVGNIKHPLGGEGELERTRIREILSTASSSQIRNHETTKKKRCDINKQHSKQAKTRKLRENTKCLQTRFIPYSTFKY